MIKVGSLAYRLFALPAGFAVVIIIRLLRPVCLFRIGRLPSHEIGHYATNIEIYLCEIDAGVQKIRRRTLDIWYRNPDHLVANRQLDEMWSRVIRISSSRAVHLADVLNRRLPGGAKHTIAHHDRDAYGLYERFPPHLKFDSDELTRGRKFLEKTTGNPNQKFVCLSVRDARYKNKQFQDRDVLKDDYRNNSIEKYCKVSMFLVSSGYFVFRMGADVEKKFSTDHPMIVDYATNGMRDEFLDVFLGAHCEFCVTTVLGFDSIPEIFRRPRILTNYLPIGNFGKYGPRDLIIPKQYWLDSESRFLTFSEIVSFNFNLASCTSSYEYQLAGITLVENTPTEILEATQERLSRMAGTWTTTAENEARRVKFWSFYYRLSPPAIRSYVDGQEPIIGSAFLRNNPHWTI